MDNFLLYFENLTTLQKALWVFLCLGFCWILEFFFPLFSFSYKKWKHAGINFVFLTTSLTINALFGLATVGLFEWIDKSQVGLIQWTHFPLWVDLLITLLIFELFAQYFVHFLMHKIKWMWKFHMIHHSDTHVDATTGTRHHPGDYFLREIFALLAIVVTGAPLAFYLFYRVCTIFFTYLTHANFFVPERIDKWLSWIFITPNMHKFHHHYKRPWTNSNYGNIFSVWDRLFGTFVYDDPKKIKFGLDVLEDATDEHLSFQFKIPFNKKIKTDY